MAVIDEDHVMADEAFVLDRDPFANERMARDLAAPTDPRILLDLDERSNHRLVADLAPVQVDEAVNLDVLA